MKKKYLTLFCLILAVSLPLGAQNEEVVSGQSRQTEERTQGIGRLSRNRTTRRQAEQENETLRNELDSLQWLLDSLRGHIYLNEQEIYELSIEEPEPFEEYTTETSDSLLSLWYKNSFSMDFDAINEYNMDSVRFSSNVSDEEMMRRLAAMNSFITLPFNENVKNYIVLYSERMTTRMGQAMGLSTYYFPLFEEILLRYDLPQELKYMTIVESMLNPVATSKAGARGIWQFMYQTGRGYGLEINSFVDERLDVEKAADAAARYLRDAYKVFGDWALAISSYNCGAGNVSKAIRRANGKRDFWSIYPYLPKETRGYLPAFVGAMYAMTYYREYGIVPQNMGMPAQTDTFEIRRNLHFAQINGVVGVPVETLQNLNPQYIHDIIPGNDHPYILKLPYNWSGPFLEANRDSLYAFKADSLMGGRILTQQSASGSSSSRTSSSSGSSSTSSRVSYKVKSGDYLGKIASRYGVTVNQIKSWNNLRSNNIQIGQTLYIYTNGGPATSSSSSSSSASKTVIYTVKSGDSLTKIARLYPGVSVDRIKSANGLRSDAIRAGQKLTIPIP